MHAADLLCLDVLQHLFDSSKSVYRALRDTEEATKRSTNELQQPQTVVYAQHPYELHWVQVSHAVTCVIAGSPPFAAADAHGLLASRAYQ